MFKILPTSTEISKATMHEWYAESFLAKSKAELRDDLVLFLKKLFRGDTSINTPVYGKETALDFALKLKDRKVSNLINSCQAQPAFVVSLLIEINKRPMDTKQSPSLFLKTIEGNKTLLDMIVDHISNLQQEESADITQKKIDENREALFIFEKDLQALFRKYESWPYTGISRENSGELHDYLYKHFQFVQIVKWAETIFSLDEEKKYDDVKKMLTANPGLIDVIDKHGKTLLERAVNRGDTDMAQFLLNKGADIMLQAPPYIVFTAEVLVQTPELIAIFTGHCQENNNLEALLFLLKIMIKNHLNDQLDDVLKVLTTICKNKKTELTELFVIGSPLTTIAICHKNNVALQVLFKNGFELIDSLTEHPVLDQYYASLEQKYGAKWAKMEKERNMLNTPLCHTLESLLNHQTRPLEGLEMLDTLIEQIQNQFPEDDLHAELSRKTSSGTTIFHRMQQHFQNLTRRLEEKIQKTSAAGSDEISISEERIFQIKVFTKIMRVLPQPLTRKQLRSKGITDDDVLSILRLSML